MYLCIGPVVLYKGVPDLDNTFIGVFGGKIKIYGNNFWDFHDEPELKVDCISEQAQGSNRFLAFRLDPLLYALLLAKWERNIIWEYEKYTLYRIREIQYIESEKYIHIKILHFTVGAGDWILFQASPHYQSFASKKF